MLKDNVVSKANDLNLRAYQLSRTEQLLVLSVASMIQPQDEDFKTYRLSIKDFMELLNVADKSKYVELPKLTKGLMTKVIEIKKSHSLLQVTWFSSVEHKPGEGIIEVEFSPKLKPYLLNLKENFVSYALRQVSRLSSKYSIRIYELLKQNQFRKVIEFEMDEFRDLIGLDDTIYPRYSNMKPKILLASQKELKEKTDICFEFEEIKTGRKVTTLKFYIKSNIQAVDEVCVTKEGNTIREGKKHSIELVNAIKGIFKNVFEYDVSDKSANEILKCAIKHKDYGNEPIELIKEVAEYSKTQNITSGLVGWFKTTVKNYERPKKVFKKGTFNDFKHRNYDFKDLENKLLGWDTVTNSSGVEYKQGKIED